jgi:mono/diheme cytochrome c family protein
MTHKPLIVGFTLFLAGCLLTAYGDEKEKGKLQVDVSKIPPAAAVKGVTYEKDIKPIFDQSCVKCHGEQKPKGKLQLTNLPAIMKGGEDGKVVEPGKSADSVLVHNIAHVGDPDDYMPPPHNKAGIGPLTPEQIGLIRAWIDQGAK